MAPKKLTVKQEAFRIAYLDTKNGREAYRVAYDAEGMTNASIDKEIRRLFKHPLLRPLLERSLERGVERVQMQADAKALLSLEEHDNNLKELSTKAASDGKWAAAVTAEVKRGELRKFYIKQLEVGGVGDFENMSDEELDAALVEEAKELGIITHH